MHVFRNLFLLSAGATLFWAIQHRDQLQQAPHPSLSSVLTQASHRLPSVLSPPDTHIRSVHAAGGSEQIFFSPSQDLEHVDISLINDAHSSIKVAMYAFTDRRIAQALARKASQGVEVWVYRDREQFAQERARHSKVMAVLSGHRNIHVLVKGSNELMHEKAVLIDDRILRDGSGNWSVSATRYQDNQVTVTQDRRQIAAFDREFRAMWNRAGNLVVQ